MQATWTATDSAPLAVTLERLLSAFFKRRTQVLSVRRGSCPYRSDFHTEKLSVDLASGKSVGIFFKDFSVSSVPRKEGLRVGRREIHTYRLLSQAGVSGLPKLYGWVWDAPRTRYWMFLEDVGNWRLEKGTFTDWIQAARWLGGFHGRFLNDESTLRRAIPGLPVYRRSHYLRAAEAADRALLQSRVIDDRWSKIRQRDQERLHAVVEFFPKAAGRLLDEEPTLIHGDCYGHNILLRPSVRPTVCFVDWETVAIGPGVLDLSALLLWWGPPESDILIDHYLAAFRKKSGRRVDRARFCETLECCWVYETLANVAYLDWSEGHYGQSRHYLSLAYRLNRIEQFMSTGSVS